MKKVAIILGLIFILEWLIWGAFGLQISETAFRFGVNKKIILKDSSSLPDGLHAYFCGTGTPLPDRERTGSCLAVVAGKKVFLFDVGEGAEESLTLMGIKPSRINDVFLTHYHSDHIIGLPSFAVQRVFWGAENAALKVHGGPGIERITAGFNETYALDHQYRAAHHANGITESSFDLAPVNIPIEQGEALITVLDDNDIKISAFLVDHNPAYPALGYRVEYGGRSLCVTGDTNMTASLALGCKDVDLMIAEAISPAMTKILEEETANAGYQSMSSVMRDIRSYHITPQDVVDMAVKANAKEVALTHMIPPLPFKKLQTLFVGKPVDELPIYTTLMNDGDVISLPSTGGSEHHNAL